MRKGPWEKRVGMLLQPPDFVYSYKPVDVPFSGGQPKIDWMACDIQGQFWMVEVKQLEEDRKSLNIFLDVSAGQREALQSVSQVGVALLAVGQGSNLYVAEWSTIWKQHLDRSLQAGSSQPLIQPRTDMPTYFPWNGPKAWKEQRLYHRFARGLYPRSPLTDMTGIALTR